jgi:hypothetical protein
MVEMVRDGVRKFLFMGGQIVVAQSEGKNENDPFNFKFESEDFEGDLAALEAHGYLRGSVSGSGQVFDFTRRALEYVNALPSPPGGFSDAEKEILRTCAQTGEIRIMTVDAFGDWVRAGTVDYMTAEDPARAAKYMDALRALEAKGLVRHEGGLLNRLTGKGFDIARSL